MNVRPAEPEDRVQLVEVAERSFEASYSLSPERIEALLGEEFSEEAVGSRLDADDAAMSVAEAERPERDEPAVVGFAEVDLGDGTLHWLHVHPNYRGEGAGTALFDRAREAVEEHTGGPIAARLLESAVEGESFLDRFGLSQVGTGERAIGSEEFHEYRYERGGTEADVGEPEIDVPGTVDADGEPRPVDGDDPIPGREAPFLRVRETESGEQNYGYLCGQCGGLDVASDGLDRLNCGDCGNEHLADEWDDAYL